MKGLQFFFLLLRRGSLFQDPVDFESKRRALLASVPLGDRSIITEKSNRSPFWKIPGMYSVMASLSYFRDRNTINRMYYVSNSHRVIYVRILKSAGTSVLGGFLQLIDETLKPVSLTDEQIDALGYYFARKELPDSSRDFIRFTIVRDPYQRLVSTYLDLFDTSSSPFTYSAYWFGILDRAMSFKEFVNVISKIPVSLLGPHFAPQYYILKELKDIRVFRLDADYEELTVFLNGYGIDFQHRNKNKADYDYRSYYDIETFEVATTMYKSDIERFSYRSHQEALRNYLQR
jgi:hypothetical protein